MLVATLGCLLLDFHQKESLHIIESFVRVRDRRPIKASPVFSSEIFVLPSGNVYFTLPPLST